MQTASRIVCVLLGSTVLASLAVTGAFAAATASSADIAAPFLTINGTAVSQSTAAMYADHFRTNGVTDNTALTAQVRETIIRRELLLEAAGKAGIDKRPDVAAEADAAYRKALAEAVAIRQTIIIRRYAEDYIAHHPGNDTQLRATYQQMRSSGTGLEYKVHEVVLQNQNDADALVARLKTGMHFDVAVKNVHAGGNSFSGGDLPWTTPGHFIKPVADALQTLKKGGLTDPPIHADDGYHVLQVTDTRALKIPAFEAMKPTLVQQYQEQIITNKISELRATAVIQ